MDKKGWMNVIAQNKDSIGSRREYTAKGERITVIRHFVGDKDLQGLFFDLAVRRAKRELGL